MKLSLQKKLFLISAVPLIIIFIGILILTQYFVRNSLISDAISLSQEIAEKNAVVIKETMDKLLTATYNISEDVGSLSKKGVKRDVAYELMYSNISRNGFFGGGLVLLKNAIERDADYINAPYHTETGQFYPYISQDMATGIYDENFLDKYENELWYIDVMQDKKQSITEPFILDIANNTVADSATPEEIEKGLKLPVVTMASPIMKDSAVIGASIVDLQISRFEPILKDVKPFGTGNAVLFSGEGTIIYAAAPALISQNVSQISGKSDFDGKKIVDSIKNNEKLTFYWQDPQSGEKMYSVMLPVKFSGTDITWGLLISMIMDDAYKAVGLPRIQMIAWSMLGLIVLIVLLTLFFIRKSIVKYLHDFMSAFKDITEGEGDLTKTINIKTGDEFETLADYLNRFLFSLREIIVEIKSQAYESLDAAKELSVASSDLKRTFTGQSLEIESVASAVEEMSGSASGVADTTNSNSNVVENASTTINNGQEELKDAIASMDIILAKTSSLAKTVNQLGESSGKIGDILNVINDIADQTNLLALNAAIEAARAGDAGRGFAVVADEVRKLAERTQKATQEIKSIIVELQNGAVRASNEMNDAGGSVKDGADKTHMVEKVFEQIVNSIAQIQLNTSAISIAAGEQATALQGVSKNARVISTSIEESTETVSSFNNVTSKLASSAEKTQKLLDRFKVDKL